MGMLLIGLCIGFSIELGMAAILSANGRDEEVYKESNNPWNDCEEKRYK